MTELEACMATSDFCQLRTMTEKADCSQMIEINAHWFEVASGGGNA